MNPNSEANKIFINIEGATQKETISASESNSIPNSDTCCNRRATFPSSPSKIAATIINTIPVIYLPWKISKIAKNPENKLNIVKILGIKDF